MTTINPVTEEFMFLDPERIYDYAESDTTEHACCYCDVVDRLATTDAQPRRAGNDG